MLFSIELATVQLNLNLTKHMCSMGSTGHVFHFTHTYKPMCARKIDDVKSTAQRSCVHTRHVQDSFQMHTCMSGMHTQNLDYTCMQITSQGQQNKLYKHVHVLRCNPLVIQDINPAKEYLTIKLKRLEGVSFTDYHR